MKKGVLIPLIIVGALLITVAVIVFIVSSVEIGPAKNKPETLRQGIVVGDIISFLTDEGVIGDDDVYMKYDRDVGLFGAEGNKRYIFKRADNTYYFVEISELSYKSNGEYLGYYYRAGEKFYSVYMQNCFYNENSQYIDDRITGRYGDVTRYIVSGNRSNFKLNNVN